MSPDTLAHCINSYQFPTKARGTTFKVICMIFANGALGRSQSTAKLVAQAVSKQLSTHDEVRVILKATNYTNLAFAVLQYIETTFNNYKSAQFLFDT